MIDNALSGASTVGAVARSYFRDNDSGGSQTSGDEMTCLVVQGVRSCP